MTFKERIIENNQSLFSGLIEHAALVDRDVHERFNDKEKKMLALELKQAWNNSSFDSKNARIIQLRNGNFEWGHYQDHEAYALADEAGGLYEGLYKGESISALVNLEDDRDVVAMRTIMNHLKIEESMIGTMYFPYARGDRPTIRDDGKRELLLLETLIDDLAKSRVKKIALVDSHSPAFSWFCMKKGIAALDLSAHPLLIEESKSRGIIREDLPIGIVCGDNGAIEMGKFANDYLGAKLLMKGNKLKIEEIDENGNRKIKTMVEFFEEDLKKIEGFQVIIPEDIISSGTTMYKTIKMLLEAGVKSIVIIATHGIFSGEAVNKLGYNPMVKVVISDGRTPQKDIKNRENIIQIPAMHKMEQVLEMEKNRLDFWSKEGSKKLLDLGFCLSSWQAYNLPPFNT